MLRYDRHKQRVWFLGCRIHHGALGVLLAVFGAWLMFDDIKDFPWTRDNE